MQKIEEKFENYVEDSKCYIEKKYVKGYYFFGVIMQE